MGRWATVNWTDTGRQACLLVEVDLKAKSGKVFIPYEGLHYIMLNQITELRERQNAG